MKVFVAGATGVLGRRAVRQLAGAGHDVSGIARSPEKATLLEELGARPVTADLFDGAALKDAVDGHEVVCNLATHIPHVSRAALPGAWKENDRIRTEGSRNLVDAAVATGAARYIQESISFIYPDRGDQWVDEEVALDVPPFGESVVEAERQAARVTDAGAVGVVLRFGQFIAAESAHTIDMVRAVRRRVAPLLGADRYNSMIHADDAAAAVVAALAVPAGTYNVVEDEPLTRRESFDLLAEALGVKPPRIAPAGVARLGGKKATAMMRSERVSNKRFKEVSGWAPAFPSVRDAWPAVARELADA